MIKCPKCNIEPTYDYPEMMWYIKENNPNLNGSRLIPATFADDKFNSSDFEDLKKNMELTKVKCMKCGVFWPDSHREELIAFFKRLRMYSLLVEKEPFNEYGKWKN